VAAHSAVISPLLPSSCRFHCLYLLLCFFYHGRFGRYLPVGSLTVTSRCSNSKSTPVVAASINWTFVVPMVTLTLSVVDGLVDTVDYCCCSRCPLRWTSNLISSSLGTFRFVVCSYRWSSDTVGCRAMVTMTRSTFLVVVMDGHNGTIRISSASCVVATIALPLLYWGRSVGASLLGGLLVSRSLVVVVPVSTDLVPVVDCSVGMPPLTSIGCCCCKDSLL
jgi:hypothetical protein